MDIMIDLETFGTSVKAPIVQIGAICFDPEGSILIDTEFEITINLQSAILAGGEIDDDTVYWWRNQPSMARKSITQTGVPIEEALEAFSYHFNKFNPNYIWAKGPGDDLAWLKSAFENCSMRAPWSYHQAQDQRTLQRLAKSMGWEPSHGAVAHTALEDAKSQARAVCSAWSWVHGTTQAIGNEIVSMLSTELVETK